MSTRSGADLSNDEIRTEGWKALTERLGIAGAVRFLALHVPGLGDYTEERRELFADLTMDEALRRIEKQSRKQ